MELSNRGALELENDVHGAEVHSSGDTGSAIRNCLGMILATSRPVGKTGKPESKRVFAGNVHEVYTRFLVVATPAEFKNRVVRLIKEQVDVRATVECGVRRPNGRDIAVIVSRGGLGAIPTIKSVWRLLIEHSPEPAKIDRR